MNLTFPAYRLARPWIVLCTIVLFFSASDISAQQKVLKSGQIDQVTATKVEAQAQTNAVRRATMQVKWATASTAGTEGSGSRFKLRGTLQQSAIGRIGAGEYRANLGFWEILGLEASCCQGIRGNINGDPDDRINIADLSYIVAYLFPQDMPSGPPPGCLEEGNINGDPNNTVNVLDVTYLVAYLFGSPNGPAPPSCFSN